MPTWPGAPVTDAAKVEHGGRGIPTTRTKSKARFPSKQNVKTGIEKKCNEFAAAAFANRRIRSCERRQSQK